MKKLRTILLMYILVQGLSVFGQPKEYVDTRVVLLNGSDTILFSVVARCNLLVPEWIDERYFSNGIAWVEGEEKGIIPPSKIRYLEYIDKYSEKRCFVNSRLVFSKINSGSRPKYEHSLLLEEKASGDLSWYTEYRTHGYDGGQLTIDYFLLDSNYVRYHAFNNLKNQLKKLLKNSPEMVKMIKDTRLSWKCDKHEEQVMGIIEKYNTKYVTK